MSKKPIEGAIVQVKGRDFIATASRMGDFWRVLTPGSYQISASAPGYQPKNFAVKVEPDSEPTEIVFSLDKSGIMHVSGIVFLALIASCALVFLLMLFLLARVCHWRKKGGRGAYTSDGFKLLRDMDEEENPKIKRGSGKIGANAVMLDESELSDDEDEEEVIFSDTEFGQTKS